MRIWKQFTSRNEYGGEYEVQLQDWSEDAQPCYRVTVGYDDGAMGLSNYFYSRDYEDVNIAKRDFISRVQ